MYELTVARRFAAVHAVTLGGCPEAPHGHDWQVSVVVAARELDPDGVVCDFHLIEGRLEAVIDRLRGRDLNRTPPFDRTNPTAEEVARHIAAAIEGELPEGVGLQSVSVTEAPGCTATYRPGKGLRDW